MPSKALILACFIAFIAISIALPHKKNQNNLKGISHNQKSHKVQELAKAKDKARAKAKQINDLSGNYFIFNALSGLCLDVTGVSDSYGTQIEQWTCNGQTNQQWTLTLQSNNSYTLNPINSGLCLDINGISDSPGAIVQQWGCNGGTNQQYQISSAIDGTIIPTNSWLCLDLNTNSNAPGVDLTQLPCDGALSQQYSFQAVPAFPGTFVINSYDTGYVLDVFGGNTAEGALIDQWTLNGNPTSSNQQWTITPASDYGSYTIVTSLTGDCLDVNELSTAPGAIVQQWPCNGGPNQEWLIIPVDPVANTFKIINYNSQLALDTYPNQNGQGGYLTQWPWQGTGSQLFTFTPA
jgi:ribosomal protein S6E (S10)